MDEPATLVGCILLTVVLIALAWWRERRG